MHKSIFIGLVISSSAFAACAPTSPAACNADNCRPCFCLGPSEIIANAPVNPRTCDGDVSITVAGLYWKASQDGMEYAVEDSVIIGPLADANYLNKGEYTTPGFKPNFGFRIGLGYNSPCDGWSVGALWTTFNGRGFSQDEVKDQSQVLLPLWSAFHGLQESSYPETGGVVMGTYIKTSWNCRVNLADVVLARDSWLSKRLFLSPHMGIRGISIAQYLDIVQTGRPTWSESSQAPYNDEV